MRIFPPPSPTQLQTARQCLGPHGKLSVILPAFNLECQIFNNIGSVHQLFLNQIPFEIIVVNDGSSDKTADEINRAAKVFHPLVRAVHSPTNMGKGAALARGFAHASGSHLLLLDADLDINPSAIWHFFELMNQQQADVVIGSKMHRNSIIHYPFIRRVASFVYYSIVKLLVHLPVHDTQTGMKLFSRTTLEDAFSKMVSKRFAFDLEVLSIIHDHGFTITEAPIELDFAKKAGSLTLTNIRQVMMDTLAIFYRLKILHAYDAFDASALLVPPDSQHPPKVSVVIACPQASEVLSQCISALQAQSAQLEIIVLPDAPTSITWPSGVIEIPTGKVRPAEKRNIGITKATGDWIAFVDDDAIPQPGWLEHALPYFPNPDIAAVGGPAITPATDSFLEKMSGRVYGHFLVSGAYSRRYRPMPICLEDDLPSCNLIVRASCLHELGGFNTTYWPGEDTILCSDLVHKLQKRMVYDPQILVTHHRRPLFGPHLRQVSRYAHHRGFFARHFPTTSRRFAYMIPSLFVLGVTLGIPVIYWIPFLRPVYYSILLFYLALIILATATPQAPKTWLYTALGILTTHLTYGTGFLIGLFSKQMPNTVKPFDHQSTHPS